MNRGNIVCFIGMAISLMIGLVIYLTNGSTTYISGSFEKLGIKLISIDYPKIIKNYGCDFLWGYALCSGLQMFNSNAGSRLGLLKVITASMLLAIIMESLQKVSFISGTFDILDILVECGAICIAGFITNTYMRRHQNEKRCT
ncbi:MAG: hypothetical protein J6Z43_00995 [Clostridiales bacterium]|nr:hypothetical protein [Clostridiales bacterium]